MAGHGEKNRIHSAALNGNGIGTATFDILGTRKREGSVLHATGEKETNPPQNKRTRGKVQTLLIPTSIKRPAAESVETGLFKHTPKKTA